MTRAPDTREPTARRRGNRKKRTPADLTFTERYLNGRADAGSLDRAGEGRDAYLPTEAEIAEACQLIRAGKRDSEAEISEYGPMANPTIYARPTRLGSVWGYLI